MDRRVRGLADQMRLVPQGFYELNDAGETRKLLRNMWASVNAMRVQTRELLEPMARAPGW
jgi:hypothetical protein